jgi:multidrug efflux system outer membrane protein
VLTLAEVIDRALAASHRIGEAGARRDAVLASAAARAAADKPTVSLLGGYLRTNHIDEYAIAVPGGPTQIIYPDLPDNWRTRLDLQWPIYTSGRTSALERAARADQTAAGHDVATAQADARLDAIRAFWSLATAIESVRVVEEALALVDAHLHDVRMRREVGLSAPNDVLSAEAQRSREMLMLINARSARDVAEADLRRVIGAAPDTPIHIDAEPDERLPVLPA